MPTIHLSLREDLTEKTKKASNSFGSFVTSLNQGLELVQRVGGTAYRVLDDMFETAGKSEQLRSGFVNLSGSVEAADANLLAVQTALRGTVSELEAMEIANTALSFGLVENSEQLGEMTEIGAVLAQSLGQDASKGVADLTLALSRQSPLILDNLGVSLKLSDSFDMYAAELGKTASQLTETEKSQAFLNSALTIGRQKVAELGGFVESNATDWQRFQAALADSKEKLALFVTSGEGMADWLAGAGEGLSGLADLLPGVVATLSEAGSVLSGFGDTVSEAWAELAEGSAVLEYLGGQFERQPGYVEQALEGYKEMAAGAAALSEAQKREAAIISEVNAALGTNYTTFKQATDAARENRAAILEHREANHSGGVALQEFNEELERQKRAQEAATAALEQEQAAMAALGLTTDQTIEGKQKLKDKGKAAYDLLAKSGKFSADVLEEAWRKSLEGVESAFSSTTLEIIGDNTMLVSELTEAFGPGLFSGEDAAFATWIDREKAELLARQEEIMGPIDEAVAGGVEGGLADADLEGFGESVGETVRRSLIDVMHDKELVKAVAAAFGIFTGQGIGDTAAGQGRSIDDLDARQRQQVEEILGKGAFDAIVSQGLQGAMSAIEKGDLLALKRIRDGALDNARNASRHGNRVHNRGFIESNKLLADLVRDLAKSFSLEIPGFAQGGIGNFGRETLAMLHGREAILPLARGGSEVRDAIMGGDVMRALEMLAAETRVQTEVVGNLLSDVAINTRVAAEGTEKGGSTIARYQEERTKRAREVSRDPTLGVTTARRL